MSRFLQAKLFVLLLALGWIAASTTLAQDAADDPFGFPGDPPATEAASESDDNPFGFAEENTPAREAAEQAEVTTEHHDSTPVFWAEDRPGASERIQRVLRQPLHDFGLEFQDTHLSEVVDFLRAEYDIEIQLDLSALDDLGISTNDPVTVNLRNISLGAALRIMLRQLELTYIVSDEVLLITSEDEALTRMVVAVYPVGDILAVKQGFEEDHSADDKRRKPEDIEALVDLIISTVSSDTWIDNGGPEADISTIQPGLLVVTSTQDVHTQIQRLLRALRMAKQHEFAVPHRGESMADRREREAEEQRRIEAYRQGEQIPGGGGGIF